MCLKRFIATDGHHEPYITAEAKMADWITRNPHANVLAPIALVMSMGQLVGTLTPFCDETLLVRWRRQRRVHTR